jgi:hypothetical protein
MPGISTGPGRAAHGDAATAEHAILKRTRNQLRLMNGILRKTRKKIQAYGISTSRRPARTLSSPA